MFRNHFSSALAFATALGLATAAHAQQPPFGQQEDVADAQRVWQALVDADLAGKDMLTAKPYEGVEPHGAILVTITGDITLDGKAYPVIVKRNYMGENVTVDSVANAPNRNLAAVTVMVKREEGYDPENQNWFWAKYKADGSLDLNPAGVPLAGRVAKGAEQGCIACHAAAPGGDYVFTHDRFAM